MDMSKIKSVLGKLGFLKSYSAYILPLVMLSVASGLLIVSGFVSRGLKSKIEKGSVKLGKTVKNYSTQRVPSKQWQVEKEFQDALEADANAVAKLLRQSSQRELLSYKLFPETTDTSVLIFEEFGQFYQEAVENLINKYGARECPSETEINKALEQTRSDSTRSTGRSGRGSSSRRSRSFSSRNLDKVEQMIVDELCRVAAAGASFYAGPLDIAGYRYWSKEVVTEGEMEEDVYAYQSIQQSVEACWYWQLGYWIVEDVFKTIAAMNSGPGDVMDFPVKRLMEVSFGSGEGTRLGSTGSTSARPRYVTSNDKGLTASYTARISDERWDIIHFKVIILMKSRSVLPFMNELCSAKEHTFKRWSGAEPVQTFRHNQITVLETNINPVIVNTVTTRTGASGHELYRYGDDAVVKVELVCEYIFERVGYDEIKPEFIKNPVIEEEW